MFHPFSCDMSHTFPTAKIASVITRIDDVRPRTSDGMLASDELWRRRQNPANIEPNELDNAFDRMIAATRASAVAELPLDRR